MCSDEPTSRPADDAVPFAHVWSSAAAKLSLIGRPLTGVRGLVDLHCPHDLGLGKLGGACATPPLIGRRDGTPLLPCLQDVGADSSLPAGLWSRDRYCGQGQVKAAPRMNSAALLAGFGLLRAPRFRIWPILFVDRARGDDGTTARILIQRASIQGQDIQDLHLTQTSAAAPRPLSIQRLTIETPTPLHTWHRPPASGEGNPAGTREVGRDGRGKGAPQGKD